MCLAVPVKVLERDSDKTAMVEIDGVKLSVSTLLIGDIAPDDYVLVHAGFIIEKLHPEDARDKIALFEEYRQKVEGN